LLRTTDISSGSIDWDTVPFCSSEPTNIEKYLLHDGDIVISRAGSVGFSYLIKNPKRAVFASYLIRFRPLINEKYVSYFLQSPDYWEAISERSLGIAIPNVNATKLRQIPIPLPPIPEQERIVERIESLFTQLDVGVAGLKRLKGALKRYKASVLKAACEGKLVPQNPSDESAEDALRMLGKTPLVVDNLSGLPEGWCWVIAEELADGSKNAMKAGPFGSSLKKEFYVPKGYKIYGQEQVISGDPHFGDYYIDNERYEQLKSNAVKPGDILISLVGTIGKVLILPENIEPGIINPRLVKLSFAKKIIKGKYFKIYMETETAKHYFDRVSHGETMQILNLGILKQLPIPIPPLAEQQRIVAEVERRFSLVQDLEQIIEANLKRAGRLCQAILKRAFEGRLV
jgi:type I restriction enzyme S subunit